MSMPIGSPSFVTALQRTGVLQIRSCGAGDPLLPSTVFSWVELLCIPAVRFSTRRGKSSWFSPEWTHNNEPITMPRTCWLMLFYSS